MSRAIVQRGTLFLVRLDPAGAELHSALVAILFGAVLLLPDATFTRSPAYYSLSEIAPEWVWGTIWLVVGIAQGAGVALVSGFGQCAWRVRQFATFSATVLWFWWLWSLWSSTGLTTATTTYAVVMAGSGWGWLRVGR